jgi:hypothetical protein
LEVLENGRQASHIIIFAPVEVNPKHTDVLFNIESNAFLASDMNTAPLIPDVPDCKNYT